MSQDHPGTDELRPPQATVPLLAIAVIRIVKRLQLVAIALSVTLGTPVLAADTGASPQTLPESAQTGAADNEGEDEDDDADYPDDGSRTLNIRPGSATATGLLPLSPSEEKDLLGNWGDSASEAED